MTDLVGQPAVNRDKPLLPVRADLHDACNSILLLFAPAVHGDFVLAEFLGAYTVIHFADIIGRNLNCLFGSLFKQLEPGGGFQINLNGLRSRQIIMNRNGYRNLVILGQGDGQIQVDKEFLENPKRSFTVAQLARLRIRQCGHAPGCNRIRHGQGD